MIDAGHHIQHIRALGLKVQHWSQAAFDSRSIVFDVSLPAGASVIPFLPNSVEGILHILVGLCVLTGFSITTASFAIYEVSEHRSGSKRLQHIAGISEAFYWAVNFFYDMVKTSTSERRKI